MTTRLAHLARLALLALALALPAAPAPAQAPPAPAQPLRPVPGDFLYTAAVTPPPGGFLPGGLYRAAFPEAFLGGGLHPDLGALRLFDAQGRETPFALLPAAVPRRPERTVPLVVQSFVEYGRSFTVVGALPPGHGPGPDGIVALDIASANRDFAYWAAVEGRAEDGWEPLAEGPVYDFSSRVDLRRTRITLPPSHHTAYRLRLSIADHVPDELRSLGLAAEQLRALILGEDKQPFRIDALRAVLPGNEAWQATASSRVTDFSVETDAGATTLALAGPRRLESARLMVQDPAFRRQVEVRAQRGGGAPSTIARAEIWRVPGGGEQTSVPLPPGHYAEVRLVIHNGDSPPLAVEAVELTHTGRNLFFYATEGAAPYTLHFGLPGVPSLPQPDYDTRRLISPDRWDEVLCTELTLAEATPNPDAPDTLAPPAPPAPRDYKLLLYVVCAVLGVALLGWLVLLLRRGDQDTPRQ